MVYTTSAPSLVHVFLRFVTAKESAHLENFTVVRPESVSYLSNLAMENAGNSRKKNNGSFVQQQTPAHHTVSHVEDNADHLRLFTTKHKIKLIYQIFQQFLSKT